MTTVTKSDRLGLIWLAQIQSGTSASAVAASANVSRQYVSRLVNQALDLIQHLQQLKAQGQLDNPNRIRVLCPGIAGLCIHGLPQLIDGTWVCAVCVETNNPNHPAFQKGEPVEDPGRWPQPKERAPLRTYSIKHPLMAMVTVKAKNVAEAKEKARRRLGVKRLPINTKIMAGE